MLSTMKRHPGWKTGGIVKRAYGPEYLLIDDGTYNPIEGVAKGHRFGQFFQYQKIFILRHLLRRNPC